MNGFCLWYIHTIVPLVQQKRVGNQKRWVLSNGREPRACAGTLHIQSRLYFWMGRSTQADHWMLRNQSCTHHFCEFPQDLVGPNSLNFSLPLPNKKDLGMDCDTGFGHHFSFTKWHALGRNLTDHIPIIQEIITHAATITTTTVILQHEQFWTKQPSNHDGHNEQSQTN